MLSNVCIELILCSLHNFSNARLILRRVIFGPCCFHKAIRLVTAKACFCVRTCRQPCWAFHNLVSRYALKAMVITLRTRLQINILIKTQVSLEIKHWRGRCETAVSINLDISLQNVVPEGKPSY